GRYFNTQGNLTAYFYGYLAAPTSGTFQVTFPQPTYADYVIFTVQHAAQINPIDTANVGTTLSGTSVTVSTSTTVGYDLLLSYPWFSRGKSFSSFGANESSFVTEYDDVAFGSRIDGSFKGAGTTSATESMTVNISGGAGTIDESMIGIAGGQT